jgi:hypothetical protein
MESSRSDGNIIQYSASRAIAEPAPTDLPRQPRKPNLRLPPGSWDTHCHIFGPKDLYPFATTSLREPADAPWERLFRRKLVTEFPDRVLWGTDWPHLNHPDPHP